MPPEMLSRGPEGCRRRKSLLRPTCSNSVSPIRRPRSMKVLSSCPRWKSGPCPFDWTTKKRPSGLPYPVTLLKEYEGELSRVGVLSTRDLPDAGDGSDVSVGGFIASRRETQTKKGDRMAFLTLEDVHGRVDVIVFPDVYREGSLDRDEEAPIVVQGRLKLSDAGAEADGEEETQTRKRRRGESRRKGSKIIAAKIMPLCELCFALKLSVHILLDASDAMCERLEELRDILFHYPGPACIPPFHGAELPKTVLKMSQEFSVRPCSQLAKRWMDCLATVVQMNNK